MRIRILSRNVKTMAVLIILVVAFIAAFYKGIVYYQKVAAAPKRVGTLISSGEWDEYFREIGNIVHHDGVYYFYYSGHKGKNYRGKNDIYVGVAVSKDGKSWSKMGKTMDVPAEDPYVVINNGVFYMYFEDKREVPDVRTSLATSVDGIHFNFKTKGVLNPKQGVQSTSASSPAAIVVDGDIKILYEMYGFFPDGRINQGQIGLYEYGRQPEEPVFIGSNDPKKYDEFVATDDITKYGNDYFMSYHTLRSGVKWTAAIARSTDLKHWIRPEAPQFDYGYNDMTVMFFDRGTCYDFVVTDSDKKSIGIYTNIKAKEVGLPVCDY